MRFHGKPVNVGPIESSVMSTPSRLPSVRRPGAGGTKSRPISIVDVSALLPFIDSSINYRKGTTINFDFPTENEVTSKQSKRRSLLPTFSRKASADETLQIKEVEEEDGVKPEQSQTQVEAKPRKAMDETDRRTMPHVSKLGRPTSLFGQGTFAGPSSTRVHRTGGSTDATTHTSAGSTDAMTHKSAGSTDSRADALAALEGGSAIPSSRLVQPPAIPKRTTSNRPQSGVPRSLARVASVKTKNSPHVRTTSNGATEKSTLDTKPRPPSIDTSVPTQTLSTASPSSPVSSSTTRQSQQPPPPATQINRRGQMLPPPRPTFTTYQQHYSPAKSSLPKPPIPSAKSVKPTAPALVEELPYTFELAKEQLELLQLSLLHQSATKALQEYEASAMRKLSKKQIKLRNECEAIRAMELEWQRVVNLTALDSWCSDPALLAEHLQILGKIYFEVSALTEPDGRYAGLVSVFEAWIEQAELSLQGQASGFLEAIPQEWHKTHTSLSLRLRALQRDVEMLPPLRSSEHDPQSSLEVLITSVAQLLDGMLKELELMTKLEKALLEREKIRVEAMVKAIDCRQVTGATDWMPAWQSVG